MAVDSAPGRKGRVAAVMGGRSAANSVRARAIARSLRPPNDELQPLQPLERAGNLGGDCSRSDRIDWHLRIYLGGFQLRQVHRSAAGAKRSFNNAIGRSRGGQLPKSTRRSPISATY